jgi:hypothetical protein
MTVEYAANERPYIDRCSRKVKMERKHIKLLEDFSVDIGLTTTGTASKRHVFHSCKRTAMEFLIALSLALPPPNLQRLVCFRNYTKLQLQLQVRLLAFSCNHVFTVNCMVGLGRVRHARFVRELGTLGRSCGVL